MPKYRVRVLLDNSKHSEIIRTGLTYQAAIDLFRFYVDCILEFGLQVRCVNVFLGKRCLKLFTNH